MLTGKKKESSGVYRGKEGMFRVEGYTVYRGK